ncbi:hypothetical protein BGP75_20930 [Motiliproteus sp. MSK22-1]|nr:hypothetical protein BGP75_20930 [Motiliproteus sp. MSK22-1]
MAIIGMAGSVFLGLEKLKEPFKLNEAYFKTVEQISVKTRLLVDDYLKTGNASGLRLAQNFLEGELRVSVSELPLTLQESLLPAIDDLQASLEVDLRAAGKLASGIQGLLVQNEREMLASLDSLQDYIDRAEGTASVGPVNNLRQTLTRILYKTAERSVLRSRYFEQPSKEIERSIANISQQIEREAVALKQLPLLGVEQEPEEDSFESMMGLDERRSDTSAMLEVVDAGGEITDEILYLSRRYLPELKRTADLIELGKIAETKVSMLTNALENRVRQSKNYIDQLRSDAENLVIVSMTLFLGVLTLVGGFTVIVQARVLSGICIISAYIRKLSSGDFSDVLEQQMGLTELHELAGCANQLQGYLYQLVREIRLEVARVEQVSESIGCFAEEIHEGTSQQTERTDEAIRTVAELLKSFNLVASHAVDAASSANEGQYSVNQSAEVMFRLEKTISELAEDVREGASMITRLREDSQNIESVLNVIISIADQTNLLALNAAIEAARAGESGRGFAVVADEVRQLAQRTAESTQEIRQIIDGLQSSSTKVAEAMARQQSQAQHSVEHSQQAGDRLRKVVTAINQINGMNTLIAQATEEQSCSADSVQESMADVQTHSKKAAERTSNARQQSENLTAVSHSLNLLVDRYVI